MGKYIPEAASQDTAYTAENTPFTEELDDYVLITCSQRLFQADFFTAFRNNGHHRCRYTNHSQHENDNRNEKDENLKFTQYISFRAGNLLYGLSLNVGIPLIEICNNSVQLISVSYNTDLCQTYLIRLFGKVLHFFQINESKLFFLTARCYDTGYLKVSHSLALTGTDRHILTDKLIRVARNLLGQFRAEEDFPLSLLRPLPTDLPIGIDLLSRLEIGTARRYRLLIHFNRIIQKGGYPYDFIA